MMKRRRLLALLPLAAMASDSTSSSPCFLCPGGDEPSSSSSLCTELGESVPFYTYDQAECVEAQMAASNNECCVTSRLGSAPPPAILDPCTLCEPLRAEDWIQVIYNDTTCDDLSAQARQISNTTQQCYELQLLGTYFCGCAPVEKCNICADGGAPAAPDLVVGPNGETCKDLHQSVSALDPLCPEIQAKGFFQCGCRAQPNIDSCSLCYDETETYIDNVINPELFGADYSCADMAVDLFASTGSVCLKGQAEAVLHCGCQTMPPLPEEIHCTLCPGGLTPSNTDTEIPNFPGITCEKFSQLVPLIFDGGSCGSLDVYRDLCECPAEAMCELCNSGQSVEDPTRMVYGLSQNVTCQQVEDAAHVIKLGSSVESFQNQCQQYRTDYSPSCCPDSVIEPLLVDFPSVSPTLNPINSLRGESAAFTATFVLWTPLLMLFVQNAGW